MVVDIILKMIYAVLYGLLSVTLLLLSDVSLNSTASTTLTTVTHALADLNAFVPLGTLFTVLGLIIAIELIIALYKILMWVLRRLPTQS